MQLLGIVGPEARSLCEHLAAHLDGRVAIVEHRIEGSPSAPDGDVDTVYELASDGTWTAAGADRTLDGILDDLAATYDHALLAGFTDADVPTVALGDADVEDPTIEADTADAVDVGEAIDALAVAEPRVTLETLVERVKASPRASHAGAIATFTGRVRTKDGDDDAETLSLTFEKYEGVAEERLRSIESELMERDGVEEVAMFHRTGTIESGEDIVFVVVLAGHREEAFETVSDGINRLKDEVPIFKHETTVEEDFWVHDKQ
ncbi:molybdopterin synthase [Halobellus salinisoli]|uniref:molybdopterin synthase n=1 Tax=Halobellus salinisoli TaxID=3108500 RepID=UPI003009E591